MQLADKEDVRPGVLVVLLSGKVAMSLQSAPLEALSKAGYPVVFMVGTLTSILLSTPWASPVESTTAWAFLNSNELPELSVMPTVTWLGL